MKCNVGKIDRVARVVLGSGLIAYAILGAQPWAYLGAIPLIAGAVGYCPLYTVFGFSSTCCGKDDSCDTKS